MEQYKPEQTTAQDVSVMPENPVPQIELEKDTTKEEEILENF